MKFVVVVVLLSCLALSDAQEPTVFDIFGMTLNAGLNATKTMAKAYLTDDGFSFKPEINGMLGMVGSHVCPEESNECSPDENWLFGCNCRKEFQDLGECKNKPCQLYKHFRDNGPDSLRQFIDATSFEETVQSMVDYILIPVSNALCECSEIIGAFAKCVRNYDGMVFDMLDLGEVKGMFDLVVDNLDWKSLKTVLKGVATAGCGVKNGKDCVLEMSKMYTSGAKVVDNSLNGEDVCLSMIRVEKEFTAYLMAMGSMDLEVETLSSFANRLMGLYVNMERKAMCDPSCAAEMSEDFWTCCSKSALEALATGEMKKAYGKLFKNMWTLFGEGAPPDLTKAIKKYLKIHDIERFCGAQTDVYRVKNEECEALEA